jgi:hypothetical protein
MGSRPGPLSARFAKRCPRTTGPTWTFPRERFPHWNAAGLNPGRELSDMSTYGQGIGVGGW